VLALLSRLDGSCLLYVAFVVNIELPEGIAEGKDVALLKLRVFPGNECVSDLTTVMRAGILNSVSTYLCSLSTFMVSDSRL
jgi:hypothetical protein